MLRVGLTGGLGSGKSAVATIFRSLGARVSQSDEIGRELMEPGQAVHRAIVDHFGAEVTAPDGRLDRGVLTRLAFAEGRVDELNGIVHPAVIEAQMRWMHAVEAEDPRAVALVESALIFETRHSPAESNPPAKVPWRTRFDRIVVVTADETVRRQRYLDRVSRASGDPVNRAAVFADFDRRAAAQWSDERKVALADFVLRNDRGLPELEAAVRELYRALRLQSEDLAAEAM